MSKIVNGYERIIRCRLPFDMRNEDPKKNYGICGLHLWFILKGPRGAVQFMAQFGVYLPSVKTTLGVNEISGWDVGYHSPIPQYEEQTGGGSCDVLGGECYYDGSILRAEEWAKEIFSARGDQKPEDILWPKLEQEYKDRFGSSDE